ncbi:MAG: hypothetical protein KAT46_04565 [Deltaproteobacteria bacterium]|nr:hypothetical protein [Deltaproteobacteria bacterium]
MKKLILAILTVSIFTFAGLADAGGFNSWMKNFAHKLKMFSSTSKSSTKTAVAGVKGAEGEVDDGLYWKTSEVTDAQVADMTEAMVYAGEGNNAMATETLSNFVKKYPNSPLVKDAREGLALLKNE